MRQMTKPGEREEKNAAKQAPTLGRHIHRIPCLSHWLLEKESTPEVQVEVQAAHPTQGPIAAHIAADAVLAPLAQAAIVPKISAPVTKFYVQRGSHVNAGELLATLENRDLTAAVLDNEGSYAAAKAVYDTSTRAQVPKDYQKANWILRRPKQISISTKIS